MKQIRNLVNGFIVGGVALAMVSALAAQTPEQVSAKVVKIHGSARYTTGNNVWQPLKEGSIVKPGTVIQTGMDSGSYVDLALSSGSETDISPVLYNPAIPGSPASPPPVAYQSKASQSMVRLTENTLLGIDRLTSLQTGAEEVTDTQLDLKTGRILGNVKKLSAASKFEVKLPNGVAGIRGTVFDISASGVIKCLVGSVVYAFVDGNGTVNTQTITGGQQFDSHSGALTPLSDGDRRGMESFVRESHPHGPPVTVPVGPPGIEHVSPHAPGQHP